MRGGRTLARLQENEYDYQNRWATGYLRGARRRARRARADQVGQKQVIITDLCYGLTSVSDSCVFTLVACSEPNGGGIVTDLNHDLYIASGTAIAGVYTYQNELVPPLCVKHKDGHRSISFQVTANDASATITVGWHGWYEDEM